MKAPMQAHYVARDVEDDCPSGKAQTTASLMKWIADVTIKRRQIRRKFRCSNLLAEAVLTNSLKEAKRELALKQEEKRRNLQNFNYQLTMTYTPIHDSAADGNNSDTVVDSTLQSCLSSLDSFFNELKSVKG